MSNNSGMDYQPRKVSNKPAKRVIMAVSPMTNSSFDVTKTSTNGIKDKMQ